MILALMYGKEIFLSIGELNNSFLTAGLFSFKIIAQQNINGCQQHTEKELTNGTFPCAELSISFYKVVAKRAL